MASQKQWDSLFEDARSVGVLRAMADEVQRGATFGQCQDLVIQAAAGQRRTGGGALAIAEVDDDALASAIVNPQLTFRDEAAARPRVAASAAKLDDEAFARAVTHPQLMFNDG